MGSKDPPITPIRVGVMGVAPRLPQEASRRRYHAVSRRP
jgi:hypothetical protein